VVHGNEPLGGGHAKSAAPAAARKHPADHRPRMADWRPTMSSLPVHLSCRLTGAARAVAAVRRRRARWPAAVERVAAAHCRAIASRHARPPPQLHFHLSAGRAPDGGYRAADALRAPLMRGARISP
jgi:hypothetical protein